MDICEKAEDAVEAGTDAEVDAADDGGEIDVDAEAMSTGEAVLVSSGDMVGCASSLSSGPP
jgi:hypothetical protein